MPKGYTLFADKSKPCAFFFSPKGCKNGDGCPWPHVQNGDTKASTSPEKKKEKAKVVVPAVAKPSKVAKKPTHVTVASTSAEPSKKRNLTVSGLKLAAPPTLLGSLGAAGTADSESSDDENGGAKKKRRHNKKGDNVATIEQQSSKSQPPPKTEKPPKVQTPKVKASLPKAEKTPKKVQTPKTEKSPKPQTPKDKTTPKLTVSKETLKAKTTPKLAVSKETPKAKTTPKQASKETPKTKATPKQASKETPKAKATPKLAATKANQEFGFGSPVPFSLAAARQQAGAKPETKKATPTKLQVTSSKEDKGRGKSFRQARTTRKLSVAKKEEAEAAEEESESNDGSDEEAESASVHEEDEEESEQEEKESEQEEEESEQEEEEVEEENFGPFSWDDLVVTTTGHSLYTSQYHFPDIDSTWVHSSSATAGGKKKTPQKGSASALDVLAIDCEMCVSEDPVSGERNSKELVRLSVVGGANGDTVVLDTLVQPSLPIVDMVTQIHGITKEHLAGVSFTMRHAQAAMARLVGQDTVLVGHALDNDLKSLKFMHSRVVDTALLYRSTEGKTCSLRELAVSLLGSEQDNPHDSISDAQIAYRCAELALTMQGPLPTVDKFSKAKRGREKYGGNAVRKQHKGSGVDAAVTLLVHRLPPGSCKETVESLFVDAAEIKPAKVTIVEFSGDGKGPTGRCLVSFKTKIHCDLAFETMNGKLEEDPTGNDAKRVYLEANKEGARRVHIKIRKME
mmetsp:Transcript_34236/g.69993  ORF Transcript_34236/g.69993 Transcript_34236/m.69993 type:complete len:739 (-) Transcript_34236:108-2324(-)